MSPDYDRRPQLRLLADLLGADVSDTGPGAGVTRSALLDLMLTHVLRQWLAQNRAADSRRGMTSSSPITKVEIFAYQIRN